MKFEISQVFCAIWAWVAFDMAVVLGAEVGWFSFEFTSIASLFDAMFVFASWLSNTGIQNKPILNFRSYFYYLDYQI